MKIGDLPISKLQFLVILLLLIGLVAGVVLVQRQQIFKSKAAVNSKMVIGFNAKGLAHYGDKKFFSPFPTSTDDIEPTLKEINRLGGKIIRIYLGNNKVSDQETARRLDRLLSLAAKYDIQLLITLINFYSVTSNPENSEYYYSDQIDPVFTEESGGVKLLSDEFFIREYKGRYFDFIKAVVSANKNHSNIYAWELGNELKYRGNPETFASFIINTSQFIKSLDPNHKISTGFLDAYHATNTQLTADQFYPLIANAIDVVTVTTYGGDRHGLPDMKWAQRNGKSSVIMEAGYENRHGREYSASEGEKKVIKWDRSERYEENINYWASEGIDAYLIWAFVRKEIMADNGDTDSRFGMDKVWKTDYDQIAQVLQNYTGKPVNSLANLKLVKFDLSNNGSFQSGKKDRSVTIINPFTEQLFRWSYSNTIYIREYYAQEGSTDYETRGYTLKLEDGAAIRLGNTAIKVNTKITY